MTEEKSLKTQAQEIMTAVDRDLQAVEAKSPATLPEIDRKANAVANLIYNAISDVDITSATEKVKRLKEKYPDATPQELSQRLIREKCQKTGMVGAVTSGAGLIPGVGTAAAVTLGTAADIGATFKLQAELVLEIAAIYDYPLTGEEKQRLVLAITGLSAGTTALARRAGQRVTVKVTEKVAEKAAEKTVLKALPVVGVLASAGTNVLSSYIIGQRADAYFRLGPEAVGTWGDSLRAITGVDERKIAGWLAESGKAAGQKVSAGASKVAGTVGPAVTAGAQKAGHTAKTGIQAYFRWLITFWSAVFRLVGWVFGFLWATIAFIPRKVAGLFRRREKAATGKKNKQSKNKHG
ncbi:MAG: DUF697 domain-containing protein [Anaerolineae bacterium]|nr:DUF697 domain-containing protein [Anaerolineae bacterium]